MLVHRHDPFRGQSASAPQITDDTQPVTRPLKLVAWVDRYPPWPGCMAGGELALHGILRQLKDRGHQVAVCTHAHPGGEPVTWRGIDVHPESEAPRLLDDVDVLISHLLWTGHARAAAVRGQVPFVYLFHNDFTIPHWRLRPPHVTGVVYNTRWLRAATLEKAPLWKQVPSVVVRPPVNPEAFEIAGPGFDRGFVTIVNPNQAKGGQQFYEIAERRRQLLFLAVEGAYGQQIRPKRGVHKHVDWQPQTSDMLGDVYARTRVLLVPSDYESFGLAAAEAAASSAVVVASDTLGLREALGPGGLFAPARNVDRWLHWLDALADRDVYEAASRAQRDHVAGLGREGVGEIDALERMLRLAAGAERVFSPAMGGHDPFRRHGRSVEVSEPAESPQEPPVPVPAGVGAGEAEKATQAVQDATEGAQAEQPLPPMQVVRLDDGLIVHDTLPEDSPARGDVVSKEIEAPEAPTDTHMQGGGDDGETAGGDTGQSETTQAVPGPLDAAATGDGPLGHDQGQPSPEPAPTRQGEAPGEQPSDGPSGDPGASPTPTDGRPALAAEVPKNATGDDGIVVWIATAPSPAEQYDRAEAAEWVEDQRPKVGRKKRRAVIAAIEPILYED